MRAWPGAVTATAVLLAACTGGDGGGGQAGAPASATTSTTATATSPVTVGATTTTAAAAPAGDPPGSVTLRISAFTVPAGAGFRVVVRASPLRLTVRRKGAGGPLSACPVAGATGPAQASGCAGLEAGRDVGMGGAQGVELTAPGGPTRVDEVTVTYLPADRSTTVVIPARPPSSCAATACEATFSLAPAQPGPFALDGRPSGGRPSLTLRSEAAGGSSRVLATAEGGGALSITATLEPAAQAVLLYREQLDGAVGPLTMDISWP